MNLLTTCFDHHRILFFTLFVHAVMWRTSAENLYAGTSLQSQVDAATPGSVIRIPAGIYSGLVDIHQSVILQGAGAELTVLDGKRTNSVLIIRPGTVVMINDLTITGGSDKGYMGQEAFGGGGIKNFGNLTMNRCQIRNNISANGVDGAGRGGGILNRSSDGPASVLLNACVIHNNRVGEGAGGGLYNDGAAAILNGCTISTNGTSYEYGGGIYGGNPLILNNCTISGNTAYSRPGAGIYAFGMTLNHCTITGNISEQGYEGKGAGLFGTVAECRNTIIAGNAVLQYPDRLLPSDCNGVTIKSLGYNLIGDGTDSVIIRGAGDQIGNASSRIDPKLGPLTKNGGLTDTHALLTGSPAVDRGKQGNLPFDQRGTRRPFDFSGIPNTSDGSDIGAFELTSGTPIFNQSPSISRIYDQSILHGTSTGPIQFMVNDAETAAERLILSSRFEIADGNTTGPTLDIVPGGSGMTRNVTVISRSTWVGTVRIILTIRDEGGSMMESTFLLNLVGPAQAKATAPESILIAGEDRALFSTIKLNGLNGVVKQVNVTLRNLTYPIPSNLWFMLVNPSGHGVVLMSKAGNGYPLNTATLRFDDSGTILPRTSAILSGTYRPTAYDEEIPWPLRGRMKDPWLARLSMLGGSNPNGLWSLYVYSPTASSQGLLGDGWSLEIITQPNTLPTISPAPLPNQATGLNTATDLLVFTIADKETPASLLEVSVSGDNETLTPWYAFRLGGSGNERTLVIKPAPDQVGSSRIEIKVSDERAATTTSFNLSVIDSANRTFSSGAIRIPESGPALYEYPSIIAVSGMKELVREIRVTLHWISHTWPSDLHVLLEGPGGQKVVLMGKTGYRYPLEEVSLQFQDSAAVNLPQSSQIHSGIYKPTRFGTAKALPAPAPPLPYETNLQAFKGILPNGNWKLFVWDDSAGDSGQIRGGWDLTILTEPIPTLSSISVTNSTSIRILDNQGAAPYPSVVAVSGLSGVISKASVSVRGLSHTWPGDILMLLVSPTGQKSYLMAKAGRNYAANNCVLEFDDAATTRLPSTGAIVSGLYQPTSYTTRWLLPPAPPGPYATNLSVFKGQSPNGTWSLYVMDDASLDVGGIGQGWSLTLAMNTGVVKAATSGGAPAKKLSNPILSEESAPFWLEPARIRAGERVQLILHGQAGHRYAIQASSNGLEWQTIKIVILSGEKSEIEDQAEDDVRFYRAVRFE